MHSLTRIQETMLTIKENDSEEVENHGVVCLCGNVADRWNRVRLR